MCKELTLCYKFDNLIRRGLIDKNGILYKYLMDVVEIFYDRWHQYDNDVIEFFNSIRHPGGRRTVNFICGPHAYRTKEMRICATQRDLQNEFRWPIRNSV